ncbi:hypothetical protein Tsubulata_030268 [Turnera subulata]|uniref:Uncharacterized protein n=1 Tax=Turnera subulata TaxID=218843 RepID=A0A9Q0FB29_9ROSI|nr:hypothetical protein Tsubulata_030268 [Turnera subulata]
MLAAMNSILSVPSLFLQINKYPCRHSSPRSQLHPLLHYAPPSNTLYSPHTRRPSVITAAAAAQEDVGPVSVASFEELQEKDWSFLDSDEWNSAQKMGRIISAAGIDGPSRVLVSIGTGAFVDRLVETSSCSFLVVVHDSLLVLAEIKDKHEDDVKCWQGELLHIPEKWVPFDVVFLYFLPALPFKLAQVLSSLAKYCSPGARVVISHPEGRQILEQQRKQYRDAVVSDLPDKMALQKAAADHSFEMIEFVDDPGFFLAVLRFSEA